MNHEREKQQLKDLVDNHLKCGKLYEYIPVSDCYLYKDKYMLFTESVRLGKSLIRSHEECLILILEKQISVTGLFIDLKILSSEVGWIRVLASDNFIEKSK